MLVCAHGLELVDAAEITHLRARQVHGLYDWVDADSDPFTADRPERLVEAKQALDDATEVVLRREANYRMPVEQIASWRPNPTAYDYTYLWTAHNLCFGGAMKERQSNRHSLLATSTISTRIW